LYCDRGETRTCCQEGCGLPIRERSPNLLRSPIAGPLLPVSTSPMPPTATRLRLPDKKTGQKKTNNTKEHNRLQKAPTQSSRLPLLKQAEPPLALVHILPQIPIGPRGLHRLSSTTAILLSSAIPTRLARTSKARRRQPVRVDDLYSLPVD
jgi:hypothetical protein